MPACEPSHEAKVYLSHKNIKYLWTDHFDTDHVGNIFGPTLLSSDLRHHLSGLKLSCINSQQISLIWWFKPILQRIVPYSSQVRMKGA